MKIIKINEINHAQDIYNKERLGALGIAIKLKCHPRTIERWAIYGVPETYFPFLRDEYGIPPIAITYFNDKIMNRYQGK